MEETKDIEQKQQYLREEILDKSYDIDEFTDFMSKYKENGIDIQNWDFSELKEAVKNFKNRVKEDESQKIERGVENIRQSFRFDDLENEKENCDENIDIDLKMINNNSNNNCVNNILNDYLKNKESQNNINKNIKEENKEKININNNNLYPDLDNNIKNNNNYTKNDNNINNKNEIKDEKNINNSSILNAKLNNSKIESEKINIQTNNNNSNNSENSPNKNSNIIDMTQNKKIVENNINNILKNSAQIAPQNIINNNINITNENFAQNLRSLNNNINIENKQRVFDDFEILDKGNVNKIVVEKINCVKQPENSLTKKDNLYVNLER